MCTQDGFRNSQASSQTMTQVEKHWKLQKLSKAIILSCLDYFVSCGRPGGFNPTHTLSFGLLNTLGRQRTHIRTHVTLMYNIRMITVHSVIGNRFSLSLDAYFMLHINRIHHPVYTLCNWLPKAYSQVSFEFNTTRRIGAVRWTQRPRRFKLHS